MSHRFNKDERQKLGNLSFKYGIRTGRRIHERPMNTPILTNGAAVISTTIQAMPVHDLLYFTPSGSCPGRFINHPILEYPFLIADRSADRTL